MGSAVRLPSELREFLQLPGPQSLVIRGPPGSGKTTLSLALLEAAAGTRVLVTNRVSTSELAREFPWLGENGAASIEIVDSSEILPSLHGIAHEASKIAMTLEADSQQKRELAEFLELPSPIQEAWSRLSSDRPSTVVVDSWDALVEHYLGKKSTRPEFSAGRPELERALLRWMGRSPSHLVLVLETDQPSQLDYLVNGVVVTRRELVNERLERWLSLPKLRGIRIANANYPYTVEGAKFQCIEPLHAYGQVGRGRPDEEPDRLPGFIWPGSRSFADAFGRLRSGGMTLIETSDDVPEYVTQNLTWPVKFHVAKNGGHVLVVPAPGLSPDEIWGPMEGARPEGHLAEVFRVVDAGGRLERAVHGQSADRRAGVVSVKSLPSPSSENPSDDNELNRWLKGGVVGGMPGLIVLYESGLEALASALKLPLGPEVTAALPATIQNTLGGSGLHMVVIGRVETSLLRSVKPMASIHIRMLNRQGRVLLYGLKPWTPGFVLAEGAKGGPYELLRIV